MARLGAAGALRSRPLLRRVVVAAILAAAVGGLSGVVLHVVLGPAPRPRVGLPELYGQAVWPVGRRPAPTFALHDQSGRLVSLARQRGRSVILAFVNPLCTGKCPLEVRELAAVEQGVAPEQRAALLLVSLDPRATAAEAVTASRRWGLGGNWHWLLGPRSELEPVWHDYGIAVPPGGGGAAHSAAVYLIDRRGYERAGVHAPFLPQFLADDLRALARPQA